MILPVEKKFIRQLQGKVIKLKFLARAVFWKMRLKQSHLDLQFWGPPIIYHPENMKIGYKVAINDFFWANAKGGITIGNNVLIGPFVIVHSANHNFYRTDMLIRDQSHTMLPVVVDDNVWIGARVTILPGVRIGQGSVVAAGSVVTQDVEPYVVVGGIPAKIIKRI